MISYKIVSSGSQGNAVIINDFILIDCGVSFKRLQNEYLKLKLVLLTHIHSDHFNKTTIKKLAYERPTLRFACCDWLVSALVDCGVKKQNIDILEPDSFYDYGICDIMPVSLVHNVPNCGYKIFFGDGSKMIYATDTNSMNGIEAHHYDLYLIEANYDEEEIQERLYRKQKNGVFAYEKQVINNHLSKSKCDDFIYNNIGSSGIYVYMHCHKDKA